MVFEHDSGNWGRKDADIVKGLLAYSAIVSREQQELYQSAVKSLIKRLRRSQGPDRKENIFRLKPERSQNQLPIPGKTPVPWKTWYAQ